MFLRWLLQRPVHALVLLGPLQRLAGRAIFRLIQRLHGGRPVPAGVVTDVKVTINPEVNDLRLGECDTFREKLTVTIPASAAVAPADIYFLADNTGSMGPVITQVQNGEYKLVWPLDVAETKPVATPAWADRK